MNNYEACGGMVFSSLDYYFYDLVIPKGSESFIIDGEKFTVPEGNIDPSPGKTLRDYIFSRSITSYDTGSKNGVMFRTLELYLIFKTIPPQFNGGGPALLKTAESEWVILTASIDKNTPLTHNRYCRFAERF